MKVMEGVALKTSKTLIYYTMNAHVQTSVRLISIAPVRSGDRRTISSARNTQNTSNESVYGRSELDSHADTTVAGRNCTPIWHTERSCDVAPFSDTYQPMKDVAIVSAATGFTSASGNQYILIFHECLYMPELSHTLINPNQLRHFHTQVQDNPYAKEPMSIISPDGDFVACLESEGTNIFLNTWSPTQTDLASFPHITLTSQQPWDPHKVAFPATKYYVKEEMESRNVSSMACQFTQSIEDDPEVEPTVYEEDIIFDTHEFNRRLVASVRVSGAQANEIEGKCIEERRRLATLITTQVIDEVNGELPEPPENPQEFQQPRTFISTGRHSNTTPEDLSERWSISVAQAKLTLDATTQRLKRSALMPLARRYRADRMFEVKRLDCIVSTDTMHAKNKSIHGELYCQVFGTKEFFVEAYPIDAKSDCHEALDRFIKDYGAPDTLVYDGAKEQVGPKTEFQATVRKYGIKGHTTERERSNQNPVEGVIRELRKRWYREVFRTYCPRRLWSYGYPFVAKIMQLTASNAGKLQGRTPLEYMTGETPDISEYLDFGWYDRVWYKENAGLGETKIGRFLGPSHRVGSLMSYWVLPSSGIPISRTTVQRVTFLETCTDSNKARFKAFDEAMQERFQDRYEDTTFTGATNSKPTMEMWAELAEDDDDFREEFNKVFNNEAVPEADDSFTPDTYDQYVNMELALDRGGDRPEFAKVKKRLKDANGRPIGVANDNPILDSRMYEVEYNDGHTASLAANVIAENLFAQVDQEGNRFVILEAIVGSRTDGTQTLQQDAFAVTSTGTKRRVQTTKGWEISVQWKDGSTTWNSLKDVKDSYPVQLAEYAVENHISEEPAFAWWAKHVLKKRDRIISKSQRFWVKTHKYGIRVPNTVKEAISIDAENGDKLWWDAILKEMKNVRPAFEIWEKRKEDLPIGYQEIKCRMIFDIKLGENFRRKARLVGGGHTTVTPASITYSSVVSRDSVRIALTIAALNGLDILACDIQNAYLTAKCRELIWTVAGPEFGSEQGSIMVVKMALYGLKSSGAAFRAKLAGLLNDIGYTPSKADPDVWMRAAIKPDGTEYYEYVLCYVDDVLAISQDPMRTIEGIQSMFKLKDDKAEPPDIYLGATLEQVETQGGTKCWSMSSEQYVKAAVTNLEATLSKQDMRLPTSLVPMSVSYHPSEDVSPELNVQGVQTYQELIGILRWAVEIGRVDILLEVSLLSSHLALPRSGHLQAVYQIFGYLKHVPKRKLYFDPVSPSISEDRFHKFEWEDFYRDAKEAIPLDGPKPRGKFMTTHCFVDANHASDKVTRQSQSGILIFCNRAPIMWFSKRQNSVETSTFGSEFTALKQAVELVKALRYKLRMFGVPIEGPTDMFCDNEAVYKNSSTPESVLRKKHHSIAYHMCREAVAAGICRIAKEDTETNLADIFTKVLPRPRRENLLNAFTY